MNRKFIFQLSLFGLIMAYGTVSLIPAKTEPIFWAVIFIVVGYIIAKVCTARYFAYGFWVNALNSIYLTASHTVFYHTYIAHHPQVQSTLLFKDNVPLSMIIVGIVCGIAFGLLQGSLAWLASRFVKNKVMPS